MNLATKLIGSATGAVVLLLGTATLASYGQDSAAPVLQAQDVIDIPAPAAADQAPSSHLIQDEIARQADDTLPSQQQAAQAQAEATARLTDDPFVVKRILPISGPIKYGEWFWDEEGAPQTGELIMTVDLDARVISVFRNGYEIGAAAVLLGTQEHPTPLGAFPILQKKRHNISSIYGAPMPHTMRLTWDGISIHGSEVENGYASHGCVGTPDEFASRLFAIADKGDVVIITRGKMIGLGDSLVGS